MTTETWKSLPVEEVAVEDLHFVQDEVKISDLLEVHYGKPSCSGDEIPHVVRYQGKLYIEDGHHRILLWILRGAESVPARVFAIGRML